MYDLHDFLNPVPIHELHEDNGYTDGQLAKHIAVYDKELPDISEADIVLVGANESRGSGITNSPANAADCIRKQLYRLHYWHADVNIADIGNIKTGATLNDSYAAIKTVLAQYFSYKELQQVIEATCIDANINLKGENPLRSENFLLELLTSEPNLVKHYNHIGFQSYFVHPRMLETMDKLHFDCHRVGVAKENIEEMEPVLRNTHLLSFDISAIKYSD